MVSEYVVYGRVGDKGQGEMGMTSDSGCVALGVAADLPRAPAGQLGDETPVAGRPWLRWHSRGAGRVGRPGPTPAPAAFSPLVLSGLRRVVSLACTAPVPGRTRVAAPQSLTSPLPLPPPRT